MYTKDRGDREQPKQKPRGQKERRLQEVQKVKQGSVRCYATEKKVTTRCSQGFSPSPNFSQISLSPLLNKASTLA
jgi:hypothetical protein